jgi:hypothetical protein
MRKIVAPILFLWLSSCAPLPPYEEYTLARAAVRAAQDVDSPRFATGLWTKADESYRSAEKAYKDESYAKARALFKTSQEFAEHAENVTRLKKFQTGDSFP